MSVKSTTVRKSPGIVGSPAELYQQFDEITERLHEILVKTGPTKHLQRQ